MTGLEFWAFMGGPVIAFVCAVWVVEGFTRVESRRRREAAAELEQLLNRRCDHIAARAGDAFELASKAYRLADLADTHSAARFEDGGWVAGVPACAGCGDRCPSQTEHVAPGDPPWRFCSGCDPELANDDDDDEPDAPSHTLGCDDED